MLAHVAVNVTDFEAGKRFYLGALEPLGYRVVYEEAGTLAYLADAHGLDLGIARRDPVGGTHVAFDCADRATVDAFYAAAWRRGESTTAARAFARSTTRTTTPPTCSTPTGTTSRPSATTRRPRLRACPGSR